MPEINESRYTVTISWDDVPHLTEEAKAEMRRSTPPHLIGAREHGIPSLGAGAIYPIALEEIEVEPFHLPDYWPRLYALDVGWNITAALWLAWDREGETLYLYNEHYRGQAPPSIHAEAVKARGAWIPGVIDPASRGRSQRDGNRLFDEYESYGLALVPAKNTVDSGIYRCWEYLTQGRLKIFSHLQNFKNEYRIYRRDIEGKIVKKNDHLMDCMRYLIHGYQEHAIEKPIPRSHGRSYAAGVPGVAY
jgi:hypothetical protein